MAAKFKLRIEQGATLRYPFVWKADGEIVDITGWTGRMQIRSEVSSTTVLVNLSTQNGGVIIEGEAGKFTVYMSAEQTANLSFDTGVYDLELVSPTGEVKRIIEGDVVLLLEVTRG